MDSFESGELSESKYSSNSCSSLIEQFLGELRRRRLRTDEFNVDEMLGDFFVGETLNESCERFNRQEESDDSFTSFLATYKSKLRSFPDGI